MNFIFSYSIYILHNNFHKNTNLFQSPQSLSHQLNLSILLVPTRGTFFSD
nr:MAG TPA: hypothetical protein [Caudoviricetes sp.]